MRCIAVDDEPRALEIIDNFISKIDFLDIVGKFRSPLDAMDYLLQNKIDLIFLDINMPDITGTEFVKIMSQKPLIIFTRRIRTIRCLREWTWNRRRSGHCLSLILF